MYELAFAVNDPSATIPVLAKGEGKWQASSPFTLAAPFKVWLAWSDWNDATLWRPLLDVIFVRGLQSARNSFRVGLFVEFSDARSNQHRRTLTSA